MTPSDFNLFLSACDKSNLSPLVEGVHGIGKSDAVKQYAKDNDLHCEILILSLMDTGDLIGIPRTADIGGIQSTVWSAPDWYSRIVNAAWPIELEVAELSSTDKSFMTKLKGTTISRSELNALYCNHYNLANDSLKLHTQTTLTYSKSKRSIVFIDEYNRSQADVRNASMQLVLDKRLHSHELPIVDGKPTFIVAAINPADGDYSTDGIDPAQANRFAHCTLEADTKSWLEWAKSANIAPVVRDFLTEHPARIHFVPAKGMATATPRSWASLSNVMHNIESIPAEIHYQLFKGLIGDEIASQFLSYYNNYFKVIKIEDIEAAIAKAQKKSTTVATVAKQVAKLISSQEVIQKQELAEQFYDKYIKVETAKEAYPLITYLAALDIEILAGFLTTKKGADVQNYLKLAKFDGELTNKSLFTSIVSKVA